jgi:agmatinase
MDTNPWFRGSYLRNFPAENPVQISIGGSLSRRSGGAGVTVIRECRTIVVTVTDCVERGHRSHQVTWNGVTLYASTFGADCHDVAYVPGTGWPEPGGFALTL